MKLKFTIYDLRFAIREKPDGAVSLLTTGGAHGVTRPAALNRQSSIVNHQSQKGVALVVTLILLSVTLVMTLAFLAISGRERDSVVTQTDTATTRLAADAGLAAAEAQIAANIVSTANPYNFGLLVSTNYISAYGFQTGVASLANVNYDYRSDNQPFTVNDRLQNLGNLFYSPRPPVFIPNPTNPAAPLDFRYYLDLNRNGRADPNGWVTNLDNNGNVLGVGFQVGDPEWIGVLERPDQPYGPNNKFIARFAFIALPVGNSLDLNAIHNQALNPALNPLNDGFFRNQGVGTWEINLAAFLADLNANQWDDNGSGGIYQYNRTNVFPFLSFPNSGAAFNDALSLLAFRYAGNYTNLAPVGGNPPPGLFTSANFFPPFQNNIDAYSMGPLQTTPAGINASGQDVRLPWAGADNTNHFFTPGELFDPTAFSAGFTSRLLNAGTNSSTYDRNTFYRMLAQLGTDTAPEAGKMNLNYDNLDPYIYTASGGSYSGVIYTNPPSVTNFVPWTPLGFFTNAADRLLKAYTARWATTYRYDGNGVLVPANNPAYLATFNVANTFGVTAIPVLISNQFVYTPAVNRLLQLAANMYDATTTSNYPDIFRPVFTVFPENGYNDVYVTGYTTNIQTSPVVYANSNPYISHNNQMGEIAPPVDVTAFLPGGLYEAAGTYTNVNVYGVPWIIGAKKGYPNFNAFSVESAFQLVRKLELMRDTNNAKQPDITWTNQMYLMNISNYLALSCWNSYQSNYPGPVDILVRCSSSIVLTNDSNMPPYFFGTNFALAMEASPNWPGWNGVVQQPSSSFLIPLNASIMTLTNAIYVQSSGALFPAGDNPGNFVDRGIRPLPHFWLMMTNRLQVAIVDYSQGLNKGRIVDYVQLGGMDSSVLLNSALGENDPNGFWNTNYDAQGNLIGVLNQTLMSQYGTVNGSTPTGPGAWTTAAIPGGPTSAGSDPAAQQVFFRSFFSSTNSYTYGGQFYVNPESVAQAPYTPMAFAIQHTTWEANDPLVHYLASDLAPHLETPEIVDFDANKLRVTTDRYQPWGAPPPSYYTGIDQNPANLAFKDALVRGSDSWDFPTNKLPTAGWLGRVHRGTPWQTVYLKSTNILAWANLGGQNGFNTWRNWTGDFNTFDAVNAAPMEDRLLFDLFTTAINDNATRGQLSVNISSNSLAAWSALFSGVTVLSNNLPDIAVRPISPGVYRYQHALPGALSPGYTNLVINPAGADVNNSALAQIAAGIDRTRATFTNRDGLVGAFEHVGDILATPQLTERAPLLNWNSAAQQGNGISDEMYEWLPQQALSLLRVGTPRYVIYSYGQALKPAKGGVYLAAGPLFGMVTNYQVVSEIATRAVVRIETARTNAISANNNGTNGTIVVTPPRAVIESFNLLPPD